MAWRRMKDYLAELERRGKLRRIAKSVDRDWEPACLAKWMFQALPAEERFGLFFEHVLGSDIPLATAALGASTETYAAALEVEPEGINEKWVHALLNPIAPRIVTDAPCHEMTMVDAKLGALPIPVWTPRKDAAPYITTIVVTRDAGSDFQNMGVYRTQVLDDHSVVINLAPGRQGHRCVRTYLDQGKAAPIAWVIAAPPAVHLATVANLPYGTEEVRVAGALMGAPVEMVKTKTVDLMVPASAEIIIEGEIRPGDVANEGPFGEFAGFMGPVSERPMARITAITHRKDPIYYGLTSQMPPSESTTMQSLTNAGVVLKILRHDAGEASVHDVHIDLTFGGLLAHGIIAMTPQYPGHGKRIGRIVADLTPLKRVTIVDADVDIRDPVHLEWAMNSRFNPVRDTVIIDDVFFPLHMDPSIRTADGRLVPGSKIVMDATQKIDAGSFSLPPRDLMMRALGVWKEIGLPEFRIPKRARLRIERS
ncbi:MAG: UbiD family decarboxylase [Candidatus Binataceae bacterium]